MVAELMTLGDMLRFFNRAGKMAFRVSSSDFAEAKGLYRHAEFAFELAHELRVASIIESFGDFSDGGVAGL